MSQLSTVYFKQCLSRTITKFRGSIVYLIYHETLDMKDSALTESAALTHMSTGMGTNHSKGFGAC